MEAAQQLSYLFQRQSRLGKLIKLIIQTSKHQERGREGADESSLQPELHLPCVRMESVISPCEAERRGPGVDGALQRRLSTRRPWGSPSSAAGPRGLRRSIRFSEAVPRARDLGVDRRQVTWTGEGSISCRRGRGARFSAVPTPKPPPHHLEAFKTADASARPRRAGQTLSGVGPRRRWFS